MAKVIKICLQCGKKFESKRWHHQKFCSVICGIRYNAERRETPTITKICPECGKEFTIPYWRRKQKFCSVKCGIDYHRNKPGEFSLRNRKKRKRKRKNRLEIKLKDGRRITLHRYLMEKELGRRLSSEEVVHHIDRDFTNNKLENLYLFKNRKEHTKSHYSLDKVVPSLMKDKIIGFDSGKYIRIDNGRDKEKNR